MEKIKRYSIPNVLIDKEKAIRRGEWLVQYGSSDWTRTSDPLINSQML